MRRIVIGCAVVLTGLAVLGHGIAQENLATYIKGAMCVACHKAKNKELVELFLETKHAKAKPEEGMKGLDVYRRVVCFNPADDTFLEPGVGCQACHGPGSDHMKGKTDEERKATMKPLPKLETPHQKLSVCGRCHGVYTVGDKALVEDFRVGDETKGDLWKLEGFKLAEVTEPGKFQQLNEFMGSNHAAHDVTCITCHTAHQEIKAEHQLRKAVPELCLDCHKEHHKDVTVEIPEGATCVACHMPNGMHTFKKPQAAGAMP